MTKDKAAEALRQIASVMEEDTEDNTRDSVSTPVDICWLNNTAEELRDIARVVDGKASKEELEAALHDADRPLGPMKPLSEANTRTVIRALKELLGK